MIAGLARFPRRTEPVECAIEEISQNQMAANELGDSMLHDTVARIEIRARRVARKDRGVCRAKLIRTLVVDGDVRIESTQLASYDGRQVFRIETLAAGVQALEAYIQAVEFRIAV